MASLLELLGQTWPARMAQSAWSAAKLPGDVYAGRTDPLSDEGIGRSADLAGMVMGGTYAGAPAGAVGAGVVKPIRAYHGSPHDFDRFDLSRIGTGEGAQAYGHGLYFAENPKVAEAYKLTGDAGSRQLDVINGELTRLAREMDKYPRRTYNKFEDPAGDALKAKYDQLLEERTRLGRMYEVNINAAPEQFLDWDKALAGQPAAQKAVMSALGGGGLSDQFLAKSGMSAYEYLAGRVPGNRPAVSEALNEAGIPGIKYLDQGSRQIDLHTMKEGDKFFAANVDKQAQSPGFATREDAQRWINAEKARTQTSNYVLFRDDIIDIVKKYGLAGAAAMYGISQDEAKAMVDDKPKTQIGRQTYGD